MEKKRIECLDIAKGIGIILVIFGHCLNINGRLFQLIFTFHMPLFFMLSGYVFKGNGSFLLLLKKRAKTLLLPFLGYYCLGLLVTLLLPVWRKGLSLAGIKSDLILANPDAVHNSSIWFLVCLFFVILLFFFINQFPVWVQVLLLTALYTVGISYSRHLFGFFGYSRLPLNLDVVPVAVCFFAFGYYFRQLRLIEKISGAGPVCFDAFVLGVFFTVIIHKSNGSVNLHGLSFGNPVLYLAGGLAGSFAVIGISALIEKAGVLSRLKNILIWYGQHSLTILGTQSLLIRLYIMVFRHFKGTELILYQFPRKHAVICTVLVTVIACPAACFLLDFVKSRMKPNK